MGAEKKKAIVLLVIAVLLWAIPIWLTFGYDADAQGCGKSGHTCSYQSYYTCVQRGWRRVCGYVQMCRCVPNSSRNRYYYYR